MIVIYDNEQWKVNIFTFHCSGQNEVTFNSFVMFAGPFAMIFYGVQIFQETGAIHLLP